MSEFTYQDALAAANGIDKKRERRGYKKSPISERLKVVDFYLKNGLANTLESFQTSLSRPFIIGPNSNARDGSKGWRLIGWQFRRSVKRHLKMRAKKKLSGLNSKIKRC